MWFLYVNISHAFWSMNTDRLSRDSRLPVIRRYIIMSIIQSRILSLLANVDSILSGLQTAAILISSSSSDMASEFMSTDPSIAQG